MLNSPFWDEVAAEERVKERARTLLTFASTRGLALPPDAEQRLVELGADALDQLIKQAFSAPDDAAATLIRVAAPRGH